jgi:hypothetical protein
LPEKVRARRELAPLRFALLDDRDARAAYLGNLSRNQRILARAGEILDAAAHAGLAVLPIKGACFAETLYGDPALRPMVDVDLAVSPADLPRAESLILGLGFRRSFAPRARWTLAHAHDVSFTDERDPDLVVELHWRLFHELAGDASVEPLFAHAIGEGARRLPAWHDHLFLTAVHAATHAFGDSPLWLVDVALLADRADLRLAWHEAGRRRLGPAYRAALATAHRALPAFVPAPPLDRMDLLRARALDRLLGDRLSAPPSRLRSLAARAVLTARPTDAAREVARKLGLRLVELGEALRSRRG